MKAHIEAKKDLKPGESLYVPDMDPDMYELKQDDALPPVITMNNPGTHQTGGCFYSYIKDAFLSVKGLFRMQKLGSFTLHDI